MTSARRRHAARAALGVLVLLAFTLAVAFVPELLACALLAALVAIAIRTPPRHP